MRISDWSSDVCSSDLSGASFRLFRPLQVRERDWRVISPVCIMMSCWWPAAPIFRKRAGHGMEIHVCGTSRFLSWNVALAENTNGLRSEEHTSELQSLMRISYADFCS